MYSTALDKIKPVTEDYFVECESKENIGKVTRGVQILVRNVSRSRGTETFALP